MSARAGIVVTGTEVLTGIIPDRNGPWLSERLREIGVDHAHTIVVGDRAEDMRGALDFLRDQRMDLIVTSGGLGPTADDLTADVVGDFQGREMFLDESLEERIWNILERFARRWRNIDLEAVRSANRKQAIVPEGATIIEPVGTAPGLVVPPQSGVAPTVVVLPGPPRELQPMWETATGTQAFAAAVANATRYELRMLRLIGIPESEIAETLRQVEANGVAIGDLEITTCLRRGEIEIATRYEPQHAQTYEALAEAVRERYSAMLFSEDSATIDDIVTGLLLGPPVKTVGVAESCTGGLLAARLTERPGSSEFMLGGLTVYSNEAKVALARVDAALIEAHGAVSIEVAEALAEGARERFGSEIGIGVTGVAGPGGGTEEKPVGRVCLSVATPSGSVTRQVDLPGDRPSVRERAVTVAYHLLRRVLLGHYDDAETRGATTLTGR